MRRSAFDLAAAAESIDVAAAAERRIVVVLTQVRSRGAETAEIRAALARRAKVLAPEVGLRVAFADAVAAGLGVTENEPTSHAADEVRALYTDLRRLLNAR